MSWLFLVVCCLFDATGDRCWYSTWEVLFSPHLPAYMAQFPPFLILWLSSLALQHCSRLTTHRTHRGFLACQFLRELHHTYPWESLHSNNSKKSPVRSNLRDGKRVETCITEVLAQKRKPQDTNLFSVPVRCISPLLPLSFFHMR